MYNNSNNRTGYRRHAPDTNPTTGSLSGFQPPRPHYDEGASFNDSTMHHGNTRWYDQQHDPGIHGVIERGVSQGHLNQNDKRIQPDPHGSAIGRPAVGDSSLYSYNQTGYAPNIYSADGNHQPKGNRSFPNVNSQLWDSASNQTNTNPGRPPPAPLPGDKFHPNVTFDSSKPPPPIPNSAHMQLPQSGSYHSNFTPPPGSYHSNFTPLPSSSSAPGLQNAHVQPSNPARHPLYPSQPPASLPPPNMHLPSNAPKFQQTPYPPQNNSHPQLPSLHINHSTPALYESQGQMKVLGTAAPPSGHSPISVKKELVAEGHASSSPGEAQGKNQDEKWLSDWLQRRGQRICEPLPSRSPMSIPKFRGLVRQSLTLQGELETCCKDLTESAENDELWESQRLHAVQVKNELERVMTQLSDETLLQQVYHNLKRNRSKRERLKRQRKERYEEKMAIARKREDLHQMIDNQRNTVQQRYLDEKREKEIKAAADTVLSEVRRKLSETSRRLEALNALVKLRQLRKVSAERKGLYASMESDREFENGIQKMVDLLTKQKEVYTREQQTLQVMLEIEQEESREKQRQDEEKRERRKEHQRERALQRLLFGKTSDNELLKPYKEFYLQGEESLAALLHIRREWDAYLVPPGSVGSSKIPSGWVVPPQPSSAVWASVLAQNK